MAQDTDRFKHAGSGIERNYEMALTCGRDDGRLRLHYMQSCILIYAQTIQDGKGGIPKMIPGSRWVITCNFILKI
jgi:hypothetical protein